MEDAEAPENLLTTLTDHTQGVRLPPIDRHTSDTELTPVTQANRPKAEKIQRLPPLQGQEVTSSVDVAAPALNSKEPRIVYLKIVFLKIGEIDTVKEHFEADVFLQARWREKSLDHGRDKWRELSSTYDPVSSRNVDFNKYWQPKLMIQNAKKGPQIKSWAEVQYGKSGEAFIVQKRQIQGEFTENLELRDFPFDYQDLGIVVSSELSKKEVVLHHDEREVSMINLSCFTDEQEWTLSDYVESVPRDTMKEITDVRKEVHPGLCMQCRATRKSGFFVWNIILIMTIISSLSFATFSVDSTLPSSRLQLSFTLTLTGVAFRFVTNQSLPKISYLTIMDKYILLSMIFNWLVSAWHAAVTRFEGTGYHGDMDDWAFYGFIILYGVFHLVFTFIVIIKMVLNNRTAKQKEDTYHTNAAAALGENWRSRRVPRHRNRLSRVGPINLPF